MASVCDSHYARGRPHRASHARDAACAGSALGNESCSRALAPAGPGARPTRCDVVLESSGWKAVWQTASNAAGHHCNSANPGEAGNVVISGHHNTAGEVFREVSEIGQPGSIFGLGDEIILVAQDGREYTYVVSRWDRFQEEGASDAERRLHALYLDQTSDPILTLVTCWPYEARTHRVVVIAELQP
jgi:LPXTG-site transpeptidase (sortase) family protein